MLTWNVNELSDIFEVSVHTVRYWISSKKLKATKICNYEGNRIRMDDLIEFLNTRPHYKQIFTDKLTNHATIGEKESNEVLKFLKRKELAL